MAEEVVVPGDQQQEPLGWRAGLPSDLREHEAVKSFKTVGDFAKSHIETATKAKELESRVANSIPKLGENATPEEREQFFTQLGRPGKPEEYELSGDKDATEWTKDWQGQFHKLGLTKDQAKGLSTAFDSRIQGMVDAHNANIGKMNVEAESVLKAELGDKYTANIELAKRLWKRDTNSDLDEAFKGADSKMRVDILRYVLKMAAKTGEDQSLRSSSGGQERKPTAFISYDKSPAPPQRMV